MVDLTNEETSCTSVSSRGAELGTASRVLGDNRLVLYQVDLNNALPLSLISDSRDIRMSIVNGELTEFNEAFWSPIAENVIDLEFEDCTISSVVFWLILERCQRLEALALRGITNPAWISDDSLEADQSEYWRRAENSLRNIRSLSLRKSWNVSDEAAKQILELMPNLTSLRLEFCSDGNLYASRWLNLEQKFLTLSLRDSNFTANDLIQIMERCGDSLLNLRLQPTEDELTTEAYEAIGQCTKLQYLSLNYLANTLEDCHLESILRETSELEHLDLEGCKKLTSQGLLQVFQLGKLRHLSLESCSGISIDSLHRLREMTTLQHLDLSGLPCNFELLCQISSLKDLRHLKLRCCQNLNTDCFAMICDNFRKLERLCLSHCAGLTDEAGTNFYQLKQLRELNISYSPNITDLFFENDIGSPDLQILKMGSSFLTDVGLRNLAKRHVGLEYLHLSKCEHITDYGLEYLVERVPLLRRLVLEDCPLLTDRSIEALRDCCPDLRKLKVSSCSIREAAVYSFAQHRPRIHIDYNSEL